MCVYIVKDGQTDWDTGDVKIINIENKMGLWSWNSKKAACVFLDVNTFGKGMTLPHQW